MGAQYSGAGALSLLRCDGQGRLPAADAAPRPETRRVPVTVHVYDIGPAIGLVNEVLRNIDTGVYHCGVEIYGIEWGFCDTPDPETDTGTGVFGVRPGSCCGFVYRESIRMGTSTVTDASFDRLIKEFQRVWQASEYDVLTCNCIHFADRLCHALGVAPLPYWVRSSSLAGERLDASCTPTGRSIFCCAEAPGAQEVHPLVEMVPAAPYPRQFGDGDQSLRGSASSPPTPPRRSSPQRPSERRAAGAGSPQTPAQAYL